MVVGGGSEDCVLEEEVWHENDGGGEELKCFKNRGASNYSYALGSHCRGKSSPGGKVIIPPLCTNTCLTLDIKFFNRISQIPELSLHHKHEPEVLFSHISTSFLFFSV